MTRPEPQHASLNRLRFVEAHSTMTPDEALLVLSRSPENRQMFEGEEPGDLATMAISRLPHRHEDRREVVILLSHTIASEAELPEVREAAAGKLVNIEPEIGLVLLEALTQHSTGAGQQFLQMVYDELTPEGHSAQGSEQATVLGELLSHNDEGIAAETLRKLVRAGDDLYVASGLAMLCAFTPDAKQLLREQFPSPVTLALAA